MKMNIKKVAIFIISLLLIFLCTKVYATTGTITKETVRLREKASTDSDIVVLVPIDKKVEITETEGEWYKVKYTDGDTTYTGYIRQDMVEVEGASTEEETQNEETTSTEEETSNEEEVTESSSETQEETADSTSTEKTTTEETAQEENTQTEDNIDEQVITEGMEITITNKIEIKILPLITSSKIGTIKAKTQITIVEIIGNWSYIETENQSGWVMTNNLEQIMETTQNEEEQTEDNTEEAKEEDSAENTEEQTENSEEETETTELYVNVTTVNLREKADSSSAILQQLGINTKVTVIEKVDDTWSKVEVSGVTGYVATEFLSETKTETTSRGNDETRTSTSEDDEEESEKTTSTSNTSSTTDSESSKSSSSSSTSSSSSSSSNSSSSSSSTSSSSSSSSTTSSVTGSDVVAYAKTLLGCKYVYGGTSPSGFDCSGFTQYVYKHFGYSISRTSSSQRSDGIAVKKANLKAGDIVCFSGHVGIYIGSNKFIHAENASSGVTISSLSESYYTKNYITARRIIY